MRAVLMGLESGFVAKQLVEQELCGIFLRPGKQLCSALALSPPQDARQNIGDSVGLSFLGFPLRDDQQAAVVDGLADGSLVDCISVHGACSLQIALNHCAALRTDASITVEVRASRAGRAQGARYDGRPAVLADDAGSRRSEEHTSE